MESSYPHHGQRHPTTTRLPYSLGCHACRRMKVKCDEAKPHCGRCMKAGRVCPGYRDVNQVVFRPINTEMTPKAKSSCLLRTWAAHGSPDHSNAVVVGSVSFVPRLLTQPTERWEMKATAHFLYHYSLAPTKGSPGYLAFLPDLLCKKSGSGYLKSGVLAAGYASLANITGLGHLERTARKHYGETLRSVSIALRNPAEASSDAALTTIVLLQMYEAINNATLAPRDPHDRGLRELQRLRRDAQPTTTTDEGLLQIIHGRIHLNSVGGLYPSQIDAELDYEGLNNKAPQVELWRLMRETSESCGHMRAMISDPRAIMLKTEIIFSLDRVYSVYLRLLRWQAAQASVLSYQLGRMFPRDDDDPRQETFPCKYHLFKHVSHGAMWIGFWCTLIYALQTLVSTLSLPHVQHLFSQEWHQSCDLTNRLRDAIDEICACVPYMMADVDQLGLPAVGKDGKALGSFFLLRGLYVAICVEELTNLQSHYILETLLRIAHVRGIKLALRPRCRWFARRGINVELQH
ncbi:hypothetical protein F4859DRAFT_193075 [Xylaria cf. heliscus]|nr:hypothetical protein F4859DRAFT_193075 [Xylaria cf. heliscus]